jgi:hypothetical protein
VLQLRLRRLAEVQIAAALGVSQSTVSRDLAWWRSHWRERLGPDSRFDPDVVLGETVALLEEVEASALLEFSRARGDAGATVALARMACLRMALKARQAMVEVLGLAGLLPVASPGRRP